MNDSFFSNPIVNSLNDLKNMGKLPMFQPEELAEITQITEEWQLDSQKKRKKKQRFFLILSFAFATLTTLSILYNLDFLSAEEDQDAIIGLFSILGVMASFFSLFTLQASPAKNIREKLKSINDKIINPKPKDKGLRRSKKDRIVFGVAGGIAQAIGIDSTYVRIGMIASFFVSMGGLIFVYIGLSFILKSEE